MAEFDDLKALVERADVAIKKARHARDMVAHSGARVGNIYLSGGGNYDAEKADVERIKVILRAEDRAKAVAVRDAQFIASAAEIREVRRAIVQAVCDACTDLSRIETRLVDGRPD